MPHAPDRNPVEQLADQFVARIRRGERPSISEYVRQYPEHAAEIEDVFPALVMMEQVDSDLKHAAQGDAPAADPVPALTQLGDFRIIREVGRGGMGVVYEAEQVSLGRRVALKVLPRQALLDSKHKQRFEREARAAARLHHTNIVPVFGVGQQDGLHYYVMQFIHGLGLDEVLVELKRLRVDGQGSRFQGRAVAAAREASAVAVAQSLVSGRFERTLLVDSDSEASDQRSGVCHQPTGTSAQPASSLDPRLSTLDPTAVGHLSDTFALSGQSEQTSRAHSRSVYWQNVSRIGVQAAEALQYAHDQGVIHRDIKPGNLLLDTRGCVWMTDFGLAKATDQQDLTHTGDVLGTLRYMAPEQFDGKADSRSDVYALGLTLYELLALQPGFDETERHKLIKQVTTGTPVRLRTVDAHIPRDLETIVHKAIERDPAQRYQTAGELAADLRRYLGDEPIRARRISIVSRFGRWCRRNPAVAGLTTTIILLLTTAAVVSGMAAIRFEDLAEQRTSEQRRAEHNLHQALDAVENMLTRVADEKLANVPFLEEVRRGLYEDALTIYRQILEREADDPAIQIELAVAQRRVAVILDKLGRHAEARTAADTAAELLSALRQQSPPVAGADLELARLLVFQAGMVNADANTGIARLDQAAKLLRPLTVDSANRDAERELAHDLYLLATLYNRRSRRADASSAFAEAERIYAMLQEHDPLDRDIAIAYAKHLQNYGNFHFDAGEWGAAEVKHRRSADVIRTRLDRDARDAEARLVHSEALRKLAGALMYQGHAQAASDHFRDAVEIQQQLVAEFPSFPDYRIRLAGSLMSASAAAVELKEYANGAKALEQAINTLEYLTETWPDVREYHGTLGGTLSNLAHVLLSAGAQEDLVYAEELATRAIAEQQLALVRPEEPNLFLLKHYFVLVMVQGRRGRVREALATCEQGLQVGRSLQQRSPDNREIGEITRQIQHLQQVGEQELREQQAAPQEDAAPERS